MKDDKLVVATRFPLRAVLEQKTLARSTPDAWRVGDKLGTPPHGKMDALGEQEKNDLLAFLMTL